MNIPQLTFTRFLAAVSVVIVHFGLFTWPFETHYLFPIFTKSVSAVSFFFVLSGFILVVSASKDEQLPQKIERKKFWINRCARILPLYLFSITVYFICHFSYNPDIPLKWQIKPFIFSIFLLQAWDFRMVMDVNYPAWTISVEAFFYLIFPWLYIILKKLSDKKLLYIMLGVWIANTYLLKILLDKQVPLNLAYYYPMFHVATFLIGVASGILFVRNHQQITHKALALWGVTLAVFCFTLYSIYAEFSFWNYYQNGLLAPLFVLIIFSISILRGWPAHVLSTPLLVFLGDISYAVYLLQVPVKEYLERYIPYFSGKDFKDLFYPYLLVLLFISSLTYFLLERPARRIIRKFA